MPNPLHAGDTARSLPCYTVEIPAVHVGYGLQAVLEVSINLTLTGTIK